MKTIRVGVVGAGIMGANHIRIARQLPGVELVAVADQSLERAKAATLPHERACSSVDELLDAVDLLIVAVPTNEHLDAAAKAIAAGVHVLVEKPLCRTVESCLSLVQQAEASNVVLAVGHVERFNAAVVELPRFLHSPVHLQAVRTSPYSARISDGVIFDLMIHDLDIALSLVGDASVVHVDGIARNVRSDTEDFASVNVAFSNGLTAHFVTSRLGQQKHRCFEVTQRDDTVLADLVRQDVTIHRMTRHEYLAEDGARYRTSSTVEIPFLESRGEPLAKELLDVVTAVRDNRVPTVTGRAGLAAVSLAKQISETVSRF